MPRDVCDPAMAANKYEDLTDHVMAVIDDGAQCEACVVEHSAGAMAANCTERYVGYACGFGQHSDGACNVTGKVDVNSRYCEHSVFDPGAQCSCVDSCDGPWGTWKAYAAASGPFPASSCTYAGDTAHACQAPQAQGQSSEADSKLADYRQWADLVAVAWGREGNEGQALVAGSSLWAPLNYSL